MIVSSHGNIVWCVIFALTVINLRYCITINYTVFLSQMTFFFLSFLFLLTIGTINRGQYDILVYTHFPMWIFRWVFFLTAV
jgi:hypothetical protein